MRRKYDIFEEFPNGALIWRDSVSRRYDAEREIQQLAEHSHNRFYASIPMTKKRSASKPNYPRTYFQPPPSAL